MVRQEPIDGLGEAASCLCYERRVRGGRRTCSRDSFNQGCLRGIGSLFLDLMQTRKEERSDALNRSPPSPHLNVALDVRDFDPAFGLTRVRGKRAKEATVPLPRVARAILAKYLAAERSVADPTAPLFLAVYRNRVGKLVRNRISSQRVWKITRSLGERGGVEGLHPHALRHACAVELLRRTKNLRAVQDHLRHADIGTTTIYARLLPQELSAVFDA